MNFLYKIRIPILTSALFFITIATQAQTSDDAIKKEIAELDELMSRTESTSKEYQKAQTIRQELTAKLTLSPNNNEMSVFGELLTKISTASHEEKTSLLEVFNQQRPKFESLKVEQKVMSESLSPEQYSVWKELITQVPNIYKEEK